MKNQTKEKSREGENRGIPKGSTSGLPSDGLRILMLAMNTPKGDFNAMMKMWLGLTLVEMIQTFPRDFP